MLRTTGSRRLGAECADARANRDAGEPPAEDIVDPVFVQIESRPRYPEWRSGAGTRQRLPLATGGVAIPVRGSNSGKLHLEPQSMVSADDTLKTRDLYASGATSCASPRVGVSACSVRFAQSKT